jgi:hypothetical protein
MDELASGQKQKKTAIQVRQALMISVIPCSVSTIATTATGKAFFITAPAVAAGSLASKVR